MLNSLLYENKPIDITLSILQLEMNSLQLNPILAPTYTIYLMISYYIYLYILTINIIEPKQIVSRRSASV